MMYTYVVLTLTSLRPEDNCVFEANLGSSLGYSMRLSQNTHKKRRLKARKIRGRKEGGRDRGDL